MIWMWGENDSKFHVLSKWRLELPITKMWQDGGRTDFNLLLSWLLGLIKFERLIRRPKSHRIGCKWCKTFICNKTKIPTKQTKVIDSKMFSYVEEQEVIGRRMNLSVHVLTFIIDSQSLLPEPEILSWNNDINSLGFHEHLKFDLERHFKLRYFFAEEAIAKMIAIDLASIKLFFF